MTRFTKRVQVFFCFLEMRGLVWQLRASKVGQSRQFLHIFQLEDLYYIINISKVLIKAQIFQMNKAKFAL